MARAQLTQPGFLEPMMPTLVDDPPAGDGWIHEIKHDGYRTLLAIGGLSTRAFTRNGHDWTRRYRPVVDAAQKLPCRSAIVDGEMVVQDESGRADFHAMRSAIPGDPERLVFFAFDLPMLDGRDLREEPLTERRRILQDLVGSAGGMQIGFSDAVAGDGPAVFAAADGMGLEGIVSKNPTSPYRSGRTLRWLKTKAFGEAEFHVVGLARDPKGPWVALLARGELDDLRYAGDAIITLRRKERDELQRAADFLEVGRPAIRQTGKQQAQWMRPGLIAKVRHLRGEEKLRHATVMALRAA